jgi:hypothetical protein
MHDHELLHRFETQAISRAEWTHRLHVRLAYLYLSQHSFEEALARIRTGIQKLNAANQVPEAPQAFAASTQTGYNETTTVAWAQLIHTTLVEQGPAATSDEFVDRHPHLLSRTLLRLFYSRAIWQEQDCKSRFVPPDLAPLPQPGKGPQPAPPIAGD